MMDGLCMLGCDAVRIGDLADYTYGEKQVQQLVQYFNALGRPAQFEAAVEAVYASYEQTKTSFATLAALTRDTKMKQIGADASALMAKIQAWADTQNKSTAPIAVPSGPRSPVYDPNKPSGWLSWIPWYAWAAGGVVVAGAVAATALPFLSAKLTRLKLQALRAGR